LNRNENVPRAGFRNGIEKIPLVSSFCKRGIEGDLHFPFSRGLPGCAGPGPRVISLYFRAAFAFAGARLAGAAFFFAFLAPPAFFTIGTSQQTSPQASQTQASSIVTAMPHSSQT